MISPILFFYIFKAERFVLFIFRYIYSHKQGIECIRACYCLTYLYRKRVALFE